MLSPHYLETLSTLHRDDLLRESDMQRLAHQLPRRRSVVRARVAALLVSLAARLDGSAIPMSMPSTVGEC